MRAEAVLAESMVALPVKSRTGAWVAVAAGFALCAGLAVWAVQGNGLLTFGAKPVAVQTATVPLAGHTAAEVATPVANLQMSYALTALPAASAK